MGNYEQFGQLMLTDNGGLTVEQQQFKDLHERICYNAKRAADHWVEMANGIMEMRDSKRYKVAGFTSFGDYTENALGIKERQAYNYVSVIEKLPAGFVKAHAAIGVTKLALLTSVNEEEREEILEKIDLDTAKTSEINAAVKAALEERDQAQKQLAIALDEKAELEKENEEFSAEYAALLKEQKRVKEENDNLRGRLDEMAKPETTVVYQQDPQQAQELKEVLASLSAAEDERDKKDDELKEVQTEKLALQDELADKDKALEKAKALNDAMVEDLKDLRKRLEEAKTASVEPAKVEIKGDAIVVFKVKFETFQDLLEDMSELIGKMNEDEAAKCKAAFHAVVEDCGI